MDITVPASDFVSTGAGLHGVGQEEGRAQLAAGHDLSLLLYRAMTLV